MLAIKSPVVWRLYPKYVMVGLFAPNRFMADMLGPRATNMKRQMGTPCDFGNDTLTPFQQGILGQFLAGSWLCLLLWRYYVYTRPVKSSLLEECTPPCRTLLQSWVHFLRLQPSSLTTATIQCCQDKKALKYNNKKVWTLSQDTKSWESGGSAL